MLFALPELSSIHSGTAGCFELGGGSLMIVDKSLLRPANIFEIYIQLKSYMCNYPNSGIAKDLQKEMVENSMIDIEDEKAFSDLRMALYGLGYKFNKEVFDNGIITRHDKQYSIVCKDLIMSVIEKPRTPLLPWKRVGYQKTTNQFYYIKPTPTEKRWKQSEIQQHFYS
jgi:hypothetical protein